MSEPCRRCPALPVRALPADAPRRGGRRSSPPASASPGRPRRPRLRPPAPRRLADLAAGRAATRCAPRRRPTAAERGRIGRGRGAAGEAQTDGGDGRKLGGRSRHRSPGPTLALDLIRPPAEPGTAPAGRSPCFTSRSPTRSSPSGTPAPPSPTGRRRRSTPSLVAARRAGRPERGVPLGARRHRPPRAAPVLAYLFPDEPADGLASARRRSGRVAPAGPGRMSAATSTAGQAIGRRSPTGRSRAARRTARTRSGTARAGRPIAGVGNRPRPPTSSSRPIRWPERGRPGCSPAAANPAAAAAGLPLARLAGGDGRRPGGGRTPDAGAGRRPR